jgi:hypothetical protein
MHLPASEMVTDAVPVDPVKAFKSLHGVAWARCPDAGQANLGGGHFLIAHQCWPLEVAFSR